MTLLGRSHIWTVGAEVLLGKPWQAARQGVLGALNLGSCLPLCSSVPLGFRAGPLMELMTPARPRSSLAG